MILHHQQELALTSQQVQRLEAIQASDSSASMPHFREAMAAQS